jgi:hypothetical protein
MRDMAPRNDRSIRNIPVSSAHKKRPTRFEASEYEEEVEPRMPRSTRRRKKGSKRFLISAVLVAAVFGILGLLLSTLFAGASVTVYPRTADIPASTSLSAQPNPPAGVLPYQTVTITSSGTTSVAASGTQKVSRQASGAMTIFNTYSAQSQRLIANTRFEAPDGKIYRIHDSVVVPGMKGSEPGTATITVYADSPGAEYNRNETRFTIPGFKGDPRYTKFYAEASSISGGFVGNEPAVAQADLDSAKAAMSAKLEEAAKNSLVAQAPEGFMLVENTFQFSYSDLRQTPDGTNKATLSQSLTTTAALVRASDVAAAVTVLSVEEYKGESVAFKDLSKVKVSAGAATKPVGKIELVVTGDTYIVWQYDKNAVVSALLGKKKDTFETIITSFRPALTGAEVTLRPFWQSQFPSDPKKITITEGVKK